MSTALALPGWGTAPERMQPLCDALGAVGIDARPLLVGHSLGGLASAAAVLDHGAEVASVTTINAPWRGTWVAWTADADEPLGPQLRWRAERLRLLRGSLRDHLDAPAGPRWSIVAAALDLAATPATSLRVPDGDRLGRSLVPVVERMIEHVVTLVSGDRTA